MRNSIDNAVMQLWSGHQSTQLLDFLTIILVKIQYRLHMFCGTQFAVDPRLVLMNKTKGLVFYIIQ